MSEHAVMKQPVIKHKELNAVSKGSNVVLNVIILVVTVCCLLPVLLVVVASFMDNTELTVSGFTLFPKKVTTFAYGYVFTQGGQILRAYGITIFVTVAGTAASVLIIAMYAYPLSLNNFRFKGFFTFIAFFTMLFGGGLVPWYILYTSYVPLKNTVWILIFPYLFNAWYMLITRTFFKTNIPDSLYESAKIDGAGDFNIFIKIVIPLSKPVLATVALFATLTYWNDWYLCLIFITKDALVNLQYMMYRVQNNLNFLNLIRSSAGTAFATPTPPALSARMAMCVIGMGPIILAYPFFQRFFIKGLTIGAVKG